MKNTLLHLACFFDNYEMVHLLICSGADSFIHKENLWGMKPRDIALYYNNTSITSLFDCYY